MNATAKKAAAQAPRMKVWEWLSECVGSHDICNHKGVSRDFKAHTGHEPTWNAYKVSEAKAAIKARGLGGYCEGPDDDLVIGGYEIAIHLAKHYVSQFHTLKMGRGSQFWEAVAALKGAGI
jgi:hypothetical protein